MPKGQYKRVKFKSLAERFFKRVVKTDTCWIWTGGIGTGGYGSIMADRNIHSKKFQIDSHRASWEIHRGQIPDGMCVLHKCDVRLCVNPDHLFLGTRTDNSIDMMSKGRQKKGTELPQSKLTEEDVIAIRGSSESTYALAKRYGVSQSTVFYAKTGARWKHIVDCHPATSLDSCRDTFTLRLPDHKYYLAATQDSHGVPRTSFFR